jgi:tRNA A-37 threonylcarbamoyl transferase component Bud32
MQVGGETIYMKRFLGRRLSLRRLGLRRPVAVDNFRIAAQLILRGVAVVPHLAASWHFGAGAGDESLLVTGTIPNAVTMDKWCRLHDARLTGNQGLCFELAVWLARLHGAGVACHDLKASNVLIHRPDGGGLEFTLLDLDNCRLRLCQATNHDIHRNFHQFFRSFQFIASPPAILRFLAVYRRERGLKKRSMRRLIAEVERRLHRRGTGYAEMLAAYRAGHNA